MTQDQLKELERLNERWANDPPDKENMEDISDSVMDLLPDVIQAVRDLENCHQQDSLKTKEINILVVENRQLTAERDAALKALDAANAKCAEMREELRRTEHGDRHGYDQKYHCFSCGLIKPDHHEKCSFVHALSADCGKGYHADSEWKPVVVALKWAHNREQSACICGEAGENRTECPVAQALAHAERITGGAQ